MATNPNIGTVHDNRVSYSGHSKDGSKTYYQRGAGAIYNSNLTFNGGWHDHNSGHSAGVCQGASAPTPNYGRFHHRRHNYFPSERLAQEPPQCPPSDDPNVFYPRRPVNNTEYAENESDYGYVEREGRARAQSRGPASTWRVPRAESADAPPSSMNYRKQGHQQPSSHRGYTKQPPTPRKHRRVDGPPPRPPHRTYHGRRGRTKVHSRSYAHHGFFGEGPNSSNSTEQGGVPVARYYDGIDPHRSYRKRELELRRTVDGSVLPLPAYSVGQADSPLSDPAIWVVAPSQQCRLMSLLFSRHPIHWGSSESYDHEVFF